MPPLQIDPASLPLSLASCSIGLPRHTFHQKIEAISRAGFQGIELSFPDLLAHATRLEGHPDNVAPALMGGFVLCADGHAERFEPPPHLECLLVVPRTAVRTAKARDGGRTQSGGIKGVLMDDADDF